MDTKFDLDTRLLEVKSRGLGSHLPDPVHDRIDKLCEKVYKAGYGRPGKGKLVAALLLAATDDPQKLVAALERYDRALVKDAVVDDIGVVGNTLSTRQPRRGPKPS